MTIIASSSTYIHINQPKVRGRKAAKLSLLLERRALLPILLRHTQCLTLRWVVNSTRHDWLAIGIERALIKNTNSESETGKNRWHGLTSPLSIKRHREGCADRGWVSLSTSLLLNHTVMLTQIFYPVLSRFMTWTETRRTPGQTTRRMLSGSKTSFHSTYLMLGLWHLDTMLMRHLEIPLRSL